MLMTVRAAAMGILTGLAIQSQAQSYLHPFDLTVSMSVEGDHVEDENIKSTMSYTHIGMDLNWNVSPWLQTKLNGKAYFRDGRTSAVFGEEFGPSSGFKVTEGSMTLIPFQALNLSAGLVRTEFSPISSAFNDKDAFAGFREVLSYQRGVFEAALTGYQVVPFQAGTSNRVIDDEKDSSLTITNLTIGFVGIEGEFKLGYTKYDFYGLTSALATDSRYLGNTLVGDGSGGQSYYLYRFHGNEWSVRAQRNFRLDDKLVFEGSAIQNDKAPVKRNAGWKIDSYYQWNIGDMAFEPHMIRFRYEPDVIPATYSRRNLGRMNRDGYAGGMNVLFKPYNLEAFVNYIDAKEVEPQLTQSDRVGYAFGLEVKYEVF